MKILHLVHNYPPEFTGGTELYVVHVVQAQAARGHEVVVVAGTDERHGECEPREHDWEGHRVIRMRRFPRPLILMTDTFDPLLLRALRKVFDRERPDLVHVHHWFNLSTSMVGLAAELGIPAALSFHDLFSVCARFFRYRTDGRCTRADRLRPCDACCDEDYPFPDWERLTDFELRSQEIHRDADLARKHLFPSNAHRDYLAPLLGSRPDQVEVVPHGVLPVPGTPAAAAELPGAFSGERPLRVGYWGNMVRAKGVSQLLEAVDRLVAGGRNITVDLWGKALEPGLEEEIAAHAARFSVTAHGDYAREALAGFRGRVDLACFVSALQESYSFTVDEAAYLGIPVVVSDRGAPRERVAGWGRVVPAEDRCALERVLAELHDRPADLAALAAATPTPPPVARAGERLLRIYEKILEQGPVPPPPAVDHRLRLEHWYKKLCARENWLQDLVRKNDS